MQMEPFGIFKTLTKGSTYKDSYLVGTYYMAGMEILKFPWVILKDSWIG